MHTGSWKRPYKLGWAAVVAQPPAGLDIFFNVLKESTEKTFNLMDMHNQETPLKN